MRCKCCMVRLHALQECSEEVVLIGRFGMNRAVEALRITPQGMLLTSSATTSFQVGFPCLEC